MTPDEVFGRTPLPVGSRLFRADNLVSQGHSDALSQPFDFDESTFRPPVGSHWKTTADGLLSLKRAGRLLATGRTLSYKRYFDDFAVMAMNNVWSDIGSDPDKTYVVQTATTVPERCILMTSDPGDLVLDPTCGSGTTAVVAEEWGRRWITIDTSRVALALARTRVMANRYPYYLLADSADGLAKEAELAGRVAEGSGEANGDIRRGFVNERIPHVTLRSIAQNPDIHGDLTREQINAAIARHAETEIMYDRPFTDTKVVRVSGPFTVESLSPHRALDRSDLSHDPEPAPDPDTGRFVDHVIENLRKAGVQNTVRAERLTFDLLDSWAGTYIQARGEYSEDGVSKVAAIAIGPEHGTVGRELVEAAAKEAVRFADLLVICGFAFDAYAEGAKALGRLKILQAKMNPDLQMPDLLKKTGAGNLFMVFGEPDIEINTEADGMLTVEIRGLDVYDPTTGVVRSHSIDEIACWFIDTNYNEESFFVRHAYFLGGDDPYERLRKTLRAEIDEAAWASLYSRPADRSRSLPPARSPSRSSITTATRS
jgi:adenine-specific DNA-methyltransferase